MLLDLGRRALAAAALVGMPLAPSALAPTTVEYGPLPDQVADLYLPSNVAAPVPTVVLVHGGFWQAPYKRDLMEPTARDLCSLTTPNPSPCPSPSPDPSPNPNPNTDPGADPECDRVPKQVRLRRRRPQPRVPPLRCGWRRRWLPEHARRRGARHRLAGERGGARDVRSRRVARRPRWPQRGCAAGPVGGTARATSKARGWCGRRRRAGPDGGRGGGRAARCAHRGRTRWPARGAPALRGLRRRLHRPRLRAHRCTPAAARYP